MQVIITQPHIIITYTSPSSPCITYFSYDVENLLLDYYTVFLTVYLILRTVVVSRSGYQNFMKSARYAFQNQLSARAPHQELSTNLLEWMTYSYFIDDDIYAHRFRAVGDPKQVFSRQSYIGSIGNSQSDCTLAGG